ncbi:MAG: LpqB family beta-propeller domain-containing protein, partial [Chloroflexota bacterium]|nr:LpqB family beta-propeller domain-containing protein [Chloroflexota bacterium]
VAALHHPNIVDILDFNEDKGVFYLVMEYVPDGSLRSLLKQHTKQQRLLPLSTSLDLIRQAAEALDYAHRSGMVHRDIKPDNLLLKHDPVTGIDIVKVADFGLARLGDSSSLTVEGQTMGTPAYMSPEQCQGIDLDRRSDIYSLGVVLFEVSTGAVPFVMKSLTDAIYKHVYVAPPSPRDVRPGLPDALSAIILRCLEKNPADRFATAGELAAELNRLLLAGVQDTPLAATYVEPVAPVEELRVLLDSGEIALTPGQVSALTVTLVNKGDAPVQASISIDGVPEEWIATPSRDVRIAPGAEVSGPLRVQIPAGAGISPGVYPVTIRATTRENPTNSAEATTRLIISPLVSSPSTLVPGGAGIGQPPNDETAGRGPAMPRWLALLAGALLLLAIAGIAYALLRSDDPNDDDVIVSGATETERASATITTASSSTATTAVGFLTSTATASDAVIDDPADSATATPTEATGAPTVETLVTDLPTEFIVFSAGRNLDDPAGSLDVYVMDPDGGNQRPLISEPDDDWLAAISPDGSRIAWVSRRHGNHQLYVALADGSGVRRLTTSGGDDLYPLWSPNGTDILFSRNEDGDDELYIVNADDGSLRRLTDNSAYDGFAVWSPDGSRIAWTSGIDGNNEIYVLEVAVEDAEPQRLTDDPASDFNPVWSPDGTQLVLVSNRAGDNDIYRIQADGSEIVALADVTADEIAPAWAPDGSRVAFCRKAADDCDVVVIDADGTGELLAATGASPNDPDITWSPDSSQFAFLSESDGNYDIWTVTLDGGASTRLTDAPGNDANLIWFALP